MAHGNYCVAVMADCVSWAICIEAIQTYRLGAGVSTGAARLGISRNIGANVFLQKKAWLCAAFAGL